MMATSEQRKKIHPHKFTLWIALGSIIMMFAGLTSAYIVKRNQGNWQEFRIPTEFYYSTLVILVSSLTMQMALKAFKERSMLQYRRMMVVTAVLGIGFAVMQWLGFGHLYREGIKLTGNVSGSFLFVISGLHIAHVLGGVIALVVMVLKNFLSKKRTYSTIGIEVVSVYWHFVDVLWLYLFVFFLWIQ
jgi:cytochrome c oxidase subunit 3